MERIVEIEKIALEGDEEVRLRPNNWSDYIGQEKLKKNLQVFINAVKIAQDHYVAEILNQKYHLYFAKGILQRISFEDSMGNQVEIVFEDIQVNPKIDPKIFDFKPASNIDILYN